ncbi:MG2 domain-containing protein [Brachymonas sp. G13]|uniref:alpha-2-macroglobulin family protein n=1 Tax=Brachymonas wangyanguii TaxID=3130163 RepID=UPI00307E478D
MSRHPVPHRRLAPPSPLRKTALRWSLPALALVAGGSALALKVESVSPRGETSEVRQFLVRFDKDAVPAGDTQAQPPFRIQCEGPAQAVIPPHDGGWRNPRTWAADFENVLPAGVRCTATSTPGFRAPDGDTLAATSIAFSSGAPYARDVQPWGGEISEDQIFILRFNGAVDAAQVQAAAQCRVEGVGEAVPLRLVSGEAREQILQSRWFADDAKKQPDQFVLLACNRKLPAEARVSLTLGQFAGKGEAAQRSWDYQVRSPLEASMSCERPNAQSACLPIRPVTVRFSAPVPIEQARQVVLEVDGKPRQPELDAQQQGSVRSVEFKPPFPEQASMRLVLPQGLQDDAGRPLRNASSFPLTVATGPMPPLVKFAAAPFGVLERFAEGPKGPALLPVTLRSVERDLAGKSLQPAGEIRTLTPQSDAEIIRWYRQLADYDQTLIERSRARKDGLRQLPPTLPEPTSEDSYKSVPDDSVETRMLSLLQGEAKAQAMTMPQIDEKDPRPFEVVGIPLTPGYHVVEITSPMLGKSLLDPHFQQRNMYVRTGALVTNLGVHVKQGRAGSLVWVTTLDGGKPVPQAQVAISGCNGKPLASGTTDANGLWQHPQAIEAPACGEYGSDNALFVSARTTDAQGVSDMAFVWTDWNRGIESWRFNVPTSTDPNPDLRAHSVLDRNLLRAGETVSMKHFARIETIQGLHAMQTLPGTLKLTHVGSDSVIEQPLGWRKMATGGMTAETQWQIPRSAKLGMYRISMKGKDAQGRDIELDSGDFRVEEFRLPVMRGSIQPVPKAPLVATQKLPVRVELAYLNGGAAKGLPVEVSASAREGWIYFPGYSDYSFGRNTDWFEYDSEDDSANPDGSGSSTRLLANRMPLALGADGTAQLELPELATSAKPQDLTLEATYSDPNGAFQTLQSRQRIWPAAVVAGIRTEGWISVDKDLKLQALALDTSGKPQANVPLSVRAIAHTTTTSRKRLVGGFYTYDNQHSTEVMGELCSGKSDSRGLLLCNARLKHPGEVELVVTATDGEGRKSQAGSSVTVTKQGEIWWGGQDHDRMDVLPEQRSYQPGDTARLQVRMPFRYATALLTVEREGILHSEVLQLNGQDPTVELKIQPEWGPNVYVSVLALRGRLRDVPWYSFFTWGYKTPREWWRAFWHDGKEYVAPTPLVDLSKPAFRLGMAELDVGLQAHTLQVSVTPDKDSFQPRQQAQVTIRALLPDGKPAANAEVAVAAVDQALLELRQNTSWDLLRAMFQQRPWGVETSTAQMEIIGRRHYGRKAVPAGGDGGGGTHVRELLDTLLFWDPRVQLDANGEARITVPLNDVLSSFRIVAVATSGQDLFGTGDTSIRTTQDLQIVSGLPPLVREGDSYIAQVTLRNTTKKPMKVELTPKATLLNLKPQAVEIPAEGAQEVVWEVSIPTQAAGEALQEIVWEISAADQAGSQASDALRVSQRLLPAVPLTVQQGLLEQVNGQEIALSTPPNSLGSADVARGGVQVTLQASLADGLPGVRDWFSQYPYTCLEQRSSRAIGMQDRPQWQAILNELPSHLDSDGLASYFPPQQGGRSRGSDTLTAYLLASAHEAGQLDPAWRLPDASRDAMLSGLTAFVEGRIERDFWSPVKDRDMRKLAAIEALSRYGKARPEMLGSIALTPEQWPTHSVIDWLNILQRLPAIAERDRLRDEAQQLLRTRLNYQGTRLSFSNEQDDYWWWLMQNADTNSARLILAVLELPGWQDDLPALVSGFIARQQHGAWSTTTANLWGGLALQRFAAKREKAEVSGQTLIRLDQQSRSIDWRKVTRVAPDAPAAELPAYGAPPAAHMYTNNLAFLPWQTAPGGTARLRLQQQGSGQPWATVQALAAVPVTAPQSAGYTVRKTITPVQQTVAGKHSRGDIWRVKLEINAASDMTWVVVSDPVPAGATLLGSGLGGDSAIATQGERSAGNGWLAYVERGFEAWRAYYEFLPRGTSSIEYTVRLNSAGSFGLPATRVQGLYAPEVFGVTPNARITVEPAP